MSLYKRFISFQLYLFFGGFYMDFSDVKDMVYI